MIFNSFEFLWLFPLIFAVYFLITMRKSLISKYPKIGNWTLLIISYGLYIKWEPVYVLIILGVTAITYFSALIIEKEQAYGKKKYLIYTGTILTLLPLLLFKYYNFLNGQLTILLDSCGISIGLPGLNWAMPLGISFFTFIALGYLFDVYYQRIEAEHNWWNYMLFVSFFPAIASGPINKAKDLLPQIKSYRAFNYTQAVEGLKWLMWGMFMKVVVADRIGALIDPLNTELIHMSGIDNFLVSILYTFQIYCDFAGYSFMALGVGKILGFELINNFNRPYFSQSITEFWRRWHISLSLWLKDYVYIPLGGNRCSKIHNYWNIFVTFLVSGIWHGANWTFIVWGILHGLFQIIEKALGLQKSNSKGGIKLLRICITFLLANFAWIFFRRPTIGDACSQIEQIFTNHDLSLKLLSSQASLFYVAIGLLVVIAKDIVDEHKVKSLQLMHHKYVIIRWGTYLAIVSMILFLGVFDSSQFIYVNF